MRMPRGLLTESTHLCLVWKGGQFLAWSSLGEAVSHVQVSRPGAPCGLSAFVYASYPDGRRDVSWPLVLCQQVVGQRVGPHPNPPTSGWIGLSFSETHVRPDPLPGAPHSVGMTEERRELVPCQGCQDRKLGSLHRMWPRKGRP